MAIITTDSKHYTAIANKIRESTGHTEATFKPSEMAQAIQEVNDGAYGYGTSVGYEYGYNDGKSEGIAEGKQAEYDRFWDTLQQNGNRRNYWGAFCSWTDEIFKPKYPIIANTTNSMFYLSQTPHIPTIDFRGASDLSSTYAHSAVVEIEKIILKSDGSQTLNSAFNGCSRLERVTFEGVIGNNVSFSASPKLSRDSIYNIFGALSDSASGKTVTLSKTAVNKAFEEIEGANDGASSAEWQDLIATRSNWTISLI